MEADLILLDLSGLDVILDMDWLARNHTSVDCYNKEVTFRRPGLPEVVFRGEVGRPLPRLISTLTAKKLLNKGCQGYLAHMIDTRVNGVRLEDIPVVRDFPDVFPEELPGLPPEKEVDFSIELIPGVQAADSKMFHINLLGCNNLKLESLNISAPKDSPNTDGIHIGYSKNIEISSSTIGTGDDCVSLGQGSKNINIFDISCGPGHGISVGSLGNYPDEREVLIRLSVWNCTSNETQNGVRIKTWPDNTTDGFVSNIVFDDIFMNNVGNPIIIDQKYCPYYKCRPELASHINVSNLSYTNIHGTSASKVAVSLVCSSDFPCQNVKIGDIN
ncbi:exopolygalacturonase-like [Ziziphus jujuba]|uniref:Exopolygalacturonase-like n=1 Tax=Ziziphus jujuba TaxID=326968 RepID=A0ABM4AAN8_ZIZJJ|nr:exopolygalacturonase-like [Ziziphus jujuba]